MKNFNFILLVFLLIVAAISCKKDSVSVNNIMLDQKELDLSVGENVTLKVTFIPKDATNKTVSWESSNTQVATVESGKVTGIMAGVATITATSQDGGKKTKCMVYVIQEPELVWVEGGTFTMGCTESECPNENELPAHQVKLSGFYIAKYTVTQKEWKGLMGGDNPSSFKGDDLPVEHVNWNDVQAYIQNLNAFTGKNYRLPTEAEWEFVARGGNQSKGYKYSGSNNINDVAWYTENSSAQTHPVGTKKPNELGVYDMSGNVSEWCNDWYSSYTSVSQTNPIGPAVGTSRVNRGASWAATEDKCKVAFRGSSNPLIKMPNLGFRLVLSAEK
jgi:formylglycine-generating enzyme required for sulfatase activity